MTPNERTLASYEERLQEYIAGVPSEVSGALKDWLDRSVEGLEPDATIFEIGSGTGRDADYIESLGFSNFQRTDAASVFVDSLRSEGHRADYFNALNNAYPVRPIDLVLADGVLLHFTTDEAVNICRKTYEALDDESGRFAFTMIEGEGEGFTDAVIGSERFFNYWKAEELDTMLRKIGFGRVAIEGSQSSNTSYISWLNVVAHK